MTHTACHGYTAGKDKWELEKTTHAGVKADSVKRRGGKPVWPLDNELDVAPNVGYSHIPESSKT